MKTLFKCSYCGAIYEDPNKALECETRHLKIEDAELLGVSGYSNILGEEFPLEARIRFSDGTEADYGFSRIVKNGGST